MCDFLLLNKDNWMDALTPEQLEDFQRRYPKTWVQKYNSRNGRYDIIEAKPDGFYKDHQHGGGQFIIVHAPGVSLEEAKQFAGQVRTFAGLDENNEPKFVLQYKNKCRMKFASLPVAIRNKMTKDFVYTVPNFTTFKTFIGTRGIDI